MTAHRQEEEVVISFSDLKNICRKYGKHIFFSAIFFSILGASLALIRPVKYRADASFREKSKAISEQAGAGRSAALSLLLGAGDSNENSAISLMKSRRLMSELAKKMNLQADIQPKGFQFKLFKRMRDNVKTSWAALKDSKLPALPELTHEIVASDIIYPCEIPLELSLAFKDGSYEVYNKKGQLVGIGELGVPFLHGECLFTIKKVTADSLDGKSYDIRFRPLPPLADELAKEIKAYPDNQDKTLIRLSWENRDRQLAANFLNTLMSTYQEYLRKEQQRVTRDQINYLNNRQEEIASQVKKMMEDHALGMARSMGSMELLAENLQRDNQKLLAIGLEIKRLQKTKADGAAYYERQNTEGDPAVINSVLNEIRGLKQQADSIALALKGKELPKKPAQRQESLEKIKQDAAEPNDKAVNGIDLTTANQIYFNYSKQINELEAEIIQHQFLMSQMQDPQFEISSLSTVLQDPVSREMIAKASSLTLQLKDQNNRSHKELERIKEDIALQRGFLIEHIKYTTDLLKLRLKLFQDKILSLQSFMLELIQQRITILTAHLQDYIDSRLSNLRQEQEVILVQQKEIQKQMEQMPSQWASEKLIDQHLEMGKKLVGQIAQLVEEKNISDNLDLSQSAPVDLSIPPIHPVKPMILLFAFLGGLIGALGMTAAAFLREISRGIEASPENLAFAGLHVSGTVKMIENEAVIPDQDLDTLRKVTAYISSPEHPKSLLIINGKGVNFSHKLCELLSLSGQKVALLPLHFDIPATDKPGLLQVIQGEASWPSIHQAAGVDTIQPGGICRFAAELISSQPFKEFYKTLQQKYDWIVAVSNASPNSGEANYLMSFFDRAVINLNGEHLQDVRGFANQFQNKKITFVISQGNNIYKKFKFHYTKRRLPYKKPYLWNSMRLKQENS